MTKLIFNFIFLYFICNFSFAQQVSFEKYYDFGHAEAGYCVQQTTDGGYIVAGRQGISIGSEKILLLKTDSLGQTQWVKFIGSPYESEAYSVKQTLDNGYVLTGNTTDSSYNVEVYLAKTNNMGDTLWTKTLSNFFPYQGLGRDVIQTPDSGFIVVANIVDYSTDTLWQILLVRTDLNGDTVWTRKFKGAYQALALSIDKIGSGGYVIGGVAYQPGNIGEGDFYLIKINQNGDTTWSKIIGSPSFDETVYSVKETSDSGFFLSGYRCCPDSGYMGNVFIVKTNINGDTVWTKQVGGLRDDWGFHGEQTSDNGYIIGGYTNSFDTSLVYLIKTDSSGDTVWTRTFGSSQDVGYFVTQTTDKGYVLTGIHGHNVDAFLIKTDSVGSITTGISEINFTQHNCFIYPNPFADFSTVMLSPKINNERELEYSLSDMLGREMLRKKIAKGSDSFRLERNNLPPGIYILQITSGFELIASQKIIIQY